MQRAQDAAGQPQQTASAGSTPVNPASIPTRRTIQLQRAGALPQRPPLMQHPARMATFHPIVSPPGFSSPGMAGKPKPKSSILYSTGKKAITRRLRYAALKRCSMYSKETQ